MTPEWAKVVTMITLGLGSMIIGLIPAAFTNYNLRRNPLLLTFLLCFGAGVLMATSLVHMLPEVSAVLGHGISEIVFCVGFLLVYLSDELLHYCCGEAIQHSHGGSSDEESQLIVPQNETTQHQHSSHHHHSHHTSYGTLNKDLKKDEQPQASAAVQTCEEHQHEHDVDDEKINEVICHTNHIEPCRQTFAGIIGMLTALTIHALIEGLAVGIQDTAAKVMILFIAIISHKFVVGFCLGVELSVSQGSTFKRHFAAIFVFSFGSVLGIALGMGLVDLNTVANSKYLPVLQGLAGGTLLYVTVCEVLPREKARWHQNRINKSAGIIQFFAFLIGFIVMTLLNLYIHDDDT